jgi:hypothetical protein
MNHYLINLKVGFLKTRGFSLLETTVIITILAILIIPNIDFQTSSLAQARNQLISDIRYIQNLALFDSKYRVIPFDNSTKSLNEAKYWFKSFWQIYITNSKNPDVIQYIIFSDSATNFKTSTFDKNVDTKREIQGSKSAKSEVLKDHFTKGQLIGNSNKIDSTNIVDSLNLTKKYRVNEIDINPTKYSKSRYYSEKIRVKRLRLLFDSFGRPYFNYSTGLKGKNHNFDYLIKDSLQIKLSKENDSLCLTVEGFTGFVYSSICKF